MTLTLRPPRIKPWSRTKVERVGHYRVFDVVKADMLLPNGEPCPHPIYTFACGTWCNVIAITPEEEVVFVWQYRHGTDAMSLEMPGGVVDAGEAPIDGARRELLEETGYAGELQLAGFSWLASASRTERFVAIVRKAHRIAEPTNESGEFCETAFMTLAEFRDHLRSGQLTDVDLGYLALDHLGVL